MKENIKVSVKSVGSLLLFYTVAFTGVESPIIIDYFTDKRD